MKVVKVKENELLAVGNRVQGDRSSAGVNCQSFTDFSGVMTVYISCGSGPKTPYLKAADVTTS